MHCAHCRRPTAYVHGHAACVAADCPLRGLNQAECCDGETAAQCPVPTSSVGRAPPPVVGAADVGPGAATTGGRR